MKTIHFYNPGEWEEQAFCGAPASWEKGTMVTSRHDLASVTCDACGRLSAHYYWPHLRAQAFERRLAARGQSESFWQWAKSRGIAVKVYCRLYDLSDHDQAILEEEGRLPYEDT